MFRRSVETLTGGNGQRMISVRLDNITTDTIYWLALGCIFIYHQEEDISTKVYTDMFNEMTKKERAKGEVMKRKSIYTTHYIADLLQCIKRDRGVKSRNALIDYAIATGRAIAMTKSQLLINQVTEAIEIELKHYTFRMEVKKI